MQRCCRYSFLVFYEILFPTIFLWYKKKSLWCLKLLYFKKRIRILNNVRIDTYTPLTFDLKALRGLRRNVPVPLTFFSELLFQTISPANKPWQMSLCPCLWRSWCAGVLVSYSFICHFLNWFSVAPYKDKPLPTPTFSSECKAVWLMFPTVTLLSESWPRRRRREWGTFTSVMSSDKGTHAQRVDATNIYPCKIGCTYTGLLTDGILLFLWFFCRNQLPWKGLCDFNLHLVRPDRFSLALGDSLT